MHKWIYKLVCKFININFFRLTYLFKTFCDIDTVTYGTVCLAVNTHHADNRISCCNTNTQTPRKTDVLHFFLHFQSGNNSHKRVLGIINRGSEFYHDTITHIFIYVTTE